MKHFLLALFSYYILNICSAFSSNSLISRCSKLRGAKTDYNTFEQPQSDLHRVIDMSKFRDLMIIGGVIGSVTAMAYPAVAVDNIDQYTTTESGLKYLDLKEGDGETPVPGDTVRVHYTGWLDDFDGEKKFDSSYDRRSPLAFKVGARQVIAGWDEGILTKLKVGGQRNLIIPPELGYGARGAGGVIPPNATLYFKIELVGIGFKK